MHSRPILTLVFALTMAGTASAWNARVSPQEANVSWPVPEDPTDRAGTFFQFEANSGPVLTADVTVDGELTALLARFSTSGTLQWSVRTPLPNTDFMYDLFLTDDEHVVAAYTDPGLQVDVVGSFNAANAMAPRYRLSLPSLPPSDPETNPLGGETRSFEPQENGNMAIVENAGGNFNILMLDPDGNVDFAKTYAFPVGDAIVIPGFPPIGGLSYSFGQVTSLPDGDYYLTTSGVDLMDQTSLVHVVRLTPEGNVRWSASVDLPGVTAITFPLEDERVLVVGGAGGAAIDSQVAMLDSSGNISFARTIEGAAVFALTPQHYSEAGELLLTGSVMTGTMENPTTDGAMIVLSETGNKLAETAYDLGPFDFVFSVGSSPAGLYFDFSSSDMNGNPTHAILGRSDGNLSNWITRSYLENVGANAIASSFLLNSEVPSITYRDESGEYLYYQQLTTDLLPDGDCDLFVDTEIPFYDPDVNVVPLSVTVEKNSISAAAWNDAPALNPFTFELISTPLAVENACGDNSGGPDPVSIWDDIVPANPEGDKLTGIGWLNDKNYPYVWLYANGGYIFILDEFSTPESIWGYDYVNGFWFWTHYLWGGWYLNLDDPQWGIAGWAKWE